MSRELVQKLLTAVRKSDHYNATGDLVQAEIFQDEAFALHWELQSLEGKKWYIVRASCSEKFADGFYGWDCNIHSEHQIFPENELPFIKDAPGYENIPVGVGEKPSVTVANEIAFLMS